MNILFCTTQSLSMMNCSKEIPHSFLSLPLLSHGISGVVRVVDDCTVIKHPGCIGDDRDERDHAIEQRIYKRLGDHPRIAKAIGFQERYIILERLKCPLRQRLLDLQQNNNLLPSTDQILKWSIQASEGLQYLHEKNVLQADVGAHNVLLDPEDNIKFCDFAGSSIDGEPSWVSASVHASYPFMDSKNPQPTVMSELFSLGSLIYEISTTRQPYYDRSDSDIERLYAAGLFPDTSDLLLGSIIQKCWTGQYKDAAEVLAEIKQIQRSIDKDGESKPEW